MKLFLSEEKVALLLADRKMSVSDLQEKSGVPAQTIRRAFKGCRPETIGKIADALGVLAFEITTTEAKE